MRKENLFGFGKGSSKLQSSSRLEKQAYDAGYRGVDGWHGTHYFDAWLKGQGDKKEWSSGLVSRLKAEYKRGGVEYEADRLLEKAKAQGKVKTGGKKGKGEGEEDKPVKYKGHRIVPVGGGEWAIPDVDRESRFESLAEAKRFVMANPKRRRNSGPVESTVSDITRTGKSMGRYLDSQLGRFVNPAIDRVQPTLTQGDSCAYVIEMESRKYLAWVVDGSGERREREFEGARAKEAAKAWARLVLFEVAKAGTQHNPAASPEQYRLAQAVLSGTARGAHMPVKVAREITEKTPAAMRSEYSRYNPEVSQMSAAQINKALDKLDEQSSKLTHEFIAAGRGNERPSEYLKMDDLGASG